MCFNLIIGDLMSSNNKNLLLGIIFLVFALIILFLNLKLRNNIKEFKFENLKPPSYIYEEEGEEEDINNQQKEKEENYSPPYEGDLGELISKGRKEDKNIFALISADGCGWCDRLKSVMNESNVKEALNDYVVGEVKYKNNVSTVKQLGVKGFPTILVLDKNGKVIKYNEGYLKSKSLINFLN